MIPRPTVLSKWFPVIVKPYVKQTSVAVSLTKMNHALS